MRWVDFDNDGFLDIVGTGIEDSMFTVVSPLYRNNGNGTFTLVPTNLPPMTGSDIQVADYDHDSLPDLFITGRDINFNAITGTFHNDGNGNFTMDTSSFRQMWTGTAKFGDVDNDNDIDILYDGVEDDIFAHSLIYLNDGNENFTEAVTNLPPTGEPGSVDWADIDHDGDLDVLLSGAYLMRNDGGGNFTDISPWTSGFFVVPAMFVDYDNDGDDDIFNMNFFNNNESTIYRNELITGISEYTGDFSFSFFPNPVNDFVNINPGDFNKPELSIITVDGKIILHEKTFYNSEYDLSSLAPGFYILELKNENSVTRKSFQKR